MRVLTVVVGLSLFCSAVVAQSDRSSITGTIFDPVGAVVASAAVEASNVATGAVFQVASTNKLVRQNITVSVAGTLRIDVVLEVGSATESVTITEAAPLFKTESGELSHNMTTDRVDNLPVINMGYGSGVGNVRNPLQAINLIPGSAFANDNTLRVNGLPAKTRCSRGVLQRV